MDALKSPGQTRSARRSLASRTLIESAIEALPEHSRAVFDARRRSADARPSPPTVSTSPRKAAKTRLHRARMLLRDALHQRAGTSKDATAFPFEAPRCDRLVEAVFALDQVIDQRACPTA